MQWRPHFKDSHLVLVCRYHDEGSINVMWGYWRAHNLEPGTNLIAHHFKLIGLPDWIPEAQEVVILIPTGFLALCLVLSSRAAAKHYLISSHCIACIRLIWHENTNACSFDIHHIKILSRSRASQRAQPMPANSPFARACSVAGGLACIRTRVHRLQNYNFVMILQHVSVQ